MKRGVILGAGLMAAMLGGCSGKDANDQAAQTGNVAAAPAVAEAPAQPSAPAPAGQSRTIAVSAQGVAPVGLTVRVKGVELGVDATILDVSASYGGTTSNDVDLAFSETFIRDEQGNKLMLKRIAGNEDLKIRAGQQMDGRLVFLGAVPPTARTITLVLNDGNDGNAITGPGLNIPIDLKAGQQ